MTTIDKDALKAKYAEERAKRLRPDGNEQYLQLKDQLAHYLEDPYTPRVEREPKTDHVTFAFIGGGFAGLVTGARLKEAGHLGGRGTDVDVRHAGLRSAVAVETDPRPPDHRS